MWNNINNNNNNNKGSDAAKRENIRYVSLYKTATWECATPIGQ